MPDTPTTPERIAEIKQGVLTNPLTYGKLVSKDLKAALLMADFDATTSVEEIYAAAQKIADKEEDENHLVRIAGKPVMMGWTNEQQWNEMPIAFICLLVVCSLILLVSLKSRRGMILPVANGLLAAIIGMSFVPLVGNVYNIISWGAPFIILVAAACHSVQFMRRYDEEYLKCKDVRATIEKTITAMFNPLMISIITDSVGFAIILFTPFENLKPASWATSIGLLYVIWVILFWLVEVDRGRREILLQSIPGKIGGQRIRKMAIKGSDCPLADSRNRSLVRLCKDVRWRGRLG
jgi:predicted RND superfamily exporter protein